jgi:hypothetical protein
MIHLLPPHTLDSRFSVQDLPEDLHLPLMNNMIVPRIVSSSMTPTIQAGDRLELSLPTSLTVGMIVVFRNDAMLVCHRIIALDAHGSLTTKGDATDGACEVIRPDSVIGVVTGVMREGTYVALGQSPQMSSVVAASTSLKDCVLTVVVRSVIWNIRLLARSSLFRQMLARLLRWTATVDVLTPGPLQSLPSHSKIASISLGTLPQTVRRLAASNGQKQTRYIIRLGPWVLAQYDLPTGSLLLRQSLRDTGLEPLVRQCCEEHHFTTE